MSKISPQAHIWNIQSPHYSPNFEGCGAFREIDPGYCNLYFTKQAFEGLHPSGSSPELSTAWFMPSQGVQLHGGLKSYRKHKPKTVLSLRLFLSDMLSW